MSNTKDQQWLHLSQPAPLSKDDTLHSSRTSFLGEMPVRSSPSDDQCPFPHHRRTREDDGDALGGANDDDADDIFSIPPKHPPSPSFQRWKKATLVLNATRRFRYTTDLADREKRLRRLRTTTHAVRAARRFQQSIVNEDSRGKASSLQESRLVKNSEDSLQHLDAPNLQLTPMTALPDRMVRLPDQMASLLQERDPNLLGEFGGVKGVARVLVTRLEDDHKGLKDDPEYIQKRKEEFGSNTYPQPPAKRLYSFMYDACKDPTLIILMVCALLSLVFGIKSHGIEEGWYDGTSIAFAVLLVVLVTSVSDYRQSLQFINLSEEKRNIPVFVIRGGRKQKISIFEVVVGDLVSLSIGDQVPADGLFVDGHALTLDESSMTGESEPVHIGHKMPYLLSGCKVADGNGTMLVTGVGMRTEWGRLMAELGEDSGEETPLQVRLNGVATFVGQIGLSVAVLVLVILLIFYFTGHKEGANKSGKYKAHHTSGTTVMNSIVDILAIAITIVVVAVPEGLPLAVTLSLAYAMKKMMADRALVRRLAACETMGSATAICTDKTGTLTLNVMTVVKVWLPGEQTENAENMPDISQEFKSLLLEGIAQVSSASVFVPQGGKPEVTGSPTEKALVIWGLSMGMDFNLVRSISEILQKETFNSVKKMAGVAVRVVKSGKVHVHWIGAAEMVLAKCDTMRGANDSISPITEKTDKDKLMQVIEGMAAESLRCIALGYREVPAEVVPVGEQLDVWKIPEEPLTLTAIVGIKDPCRPGVREAVLKCQKAGINVRMLTGDNILTAKAIATECGILVPGGLAIEGSEFRNYSDERRKEQLPKISVMARSSPLDKLLMVRTLREMGEVVGVTGDGTNDAPALHEADIGLAMGIEGTEVAKESSDIIILDDNFETVVKVVRWGRSIYANIQKFIQFQLTVNAAALTINFIAAVSSGNVPLTAVQLLWVNLIMDTLGALALATEPPTDELLERSPVGRKEPLISNIMVRNLLLQAVYQIVVLLVLQFKGKKILKLEGADATDINNTVIFNAFVLCQLFNELNARKPEKLNIFQGLFKHRLFMGIIASTLVLQVIIVEFLNKFASTVKLSWELWVVCIIIGFFSWPIALGGKFICVSKEPWMNCNLVPWRKCHRQV
eukprot:c24601_g1_i1 orf=232-3630(+)